MPGDMIFRQKPENEFQVIVPINWRDKKYKSLKES